MATTLTRVTRIVAVASTATAMYQGYWANQFEADKRRMYVDILQKEATLTDERLKARELQRQIMVLTKKVEEQEQKTDDFIALASAIIPMTSLLMYGLVRALLRERGY